MNGMIRDTHFRLYEVREDGEGIDLILYMVDLDAKNDYTIGTKENHITDQNIDFEKDSKDQNSKEVKVVMEARSKYRGLKTQMPNSTKVQRRLQVIENIFWHFFEWFQDNSFPLPENIRPIGNTEEFAHLQDYSSVWLKDVHYNLTVVQSGVIKVLHEAHKERRPYLNFSTIRSGCEAHTNADKMSDIFKTNKEAMHALIVRDRSRNQYMLNI
jgi:hypothetical protein